MSDERVFERAPDVRFRVVGEEGVLVRQEAAEVIAVNDVGARLLSLVDSERSLGEVKRVLLDEYDAEREALEADVNRFVAQLVEAGVIREVSAR